MGGIKHLFYLPHLKIILVTIMVCATAAAVLMFTGLLPGGNRNITTAVPATTTAAPDISPPYLAGAGPEPRSTDAARDSLITLHIRDDGNGVDRDSIVLKVQDEVVSPVVKGDAKDYYLSYQPASRFAYEEQVNIEITAADLAEPAGKMQFTYTFTVVSNTPPVVKVDDEITTYRGEFLEFPVSAQDSAGDTIVLTALNLPSGAKFDNTRGAFSWVPLAEGTYEVNFTASDGNLSNEETVAIEVMPQRPVRLNLVFYGDHDGEEDERIIKLCPQYVIANTPHGLWGEYDHNAKSRLLQNAAAYQAAGIKVIGYISGGYQGTGSGSGMELRWFGLEANKQFIRNMAEIDHVDGIFIDECSPFPDAMGKYYLKELSDLARSYGLIVWVNVGLDKFDPWFLTDGGFDLLHSTEEWQGQSLTPVQQQWASHISITGFDAGYTVEDAVRLTLDAWQKGIAFCYINNSNYNTLPTWLEEYGALLRQAKVK